MLQPVEIGAMDPHRFESVLSPVEYGRLLELIDRGARELRGRVIWNVNSTATGGGVVELLRPLLGYSRGGGVDVRWSVISGGAEFFGLTKLLHNRLHGFDPKPGPVSAHERAVYQQTLAANAAELVELVHPEDVVILHDPQTAGMVGAVRRTGAKVIWRCHVGLDNPNGEAHAAWSFLRPYVLDADAFVFSRERFAWEGLAPEKLAVIKPSIDAFSPKNADQSTEQTLSILARAGLLAGEPPGDAVFTRSDGTPGRVDRRADVLETAPLKPSDRVVLQVSRWDKLKDPLGVVMAFAEHIAGRTDARLVLAGPSTDSVADDPEGAEVLAAVRDTWAGLPEEARARVHLASLPMGDVEENAAIVNALQHHADVVVQKSLAEGFGLVVAEAMWKQRPIVASGIGGIQDQIIDGESGVLVADPYDLRAFGDAVVELLDDTERAERIGQAARERVRELFLAPQHLGHYFELIQRLIVDSPVGAFPHHV